MYTIRFCAWNNKIQNFKHAIHSVVRNCNKSGSHFGAKSFNIKRLKSRFENLNRKLPFLLAFRFFQIKREREKKNAYTICIRS